ncbi:MAG: response regulator [Chloroflexi bacterium]|nr:MAG: response regulator [Chloroflexota bacterium]TMG70624.1 MAG: response regulator [Chloroflexota bacterium]
MLPARRGGSSREALQHDRVPRPHRAVRQELMAGERIVFVDDEEQIRKLLSTWLSRHGYEVTLANDGWEALKAIRAKMPDLVITDVNMPNMNGFELTRRLRADHRTARIPVVMLSARKQADDVLTGYAEGADEYIPKPVEMAVLSAKIEVLVKRFRAIHGETTTKRGGNVILFVHGKGGVGCTTLAVNSAVALAATTIYRVTLLDLNLEFGNVPMLMNLAPDRTLADLAEEAHTELDDATFERYLTQDRSGVKVLAGCDTPERAELVTVPAVQQAIDHLQMQSDYVVIDAPASFSQQVLAALDVADAVIIVTAAHLPSLKATKETLDVLEKLSYPRERSVLVVNRTSGSGVEMDQIARFFNRKPDIVVPFTPACDDAADRGRPLTVLHPDSAAAKVMRDLAAQIAVAAPSGR